MRVIGHRGAASLAPENSIRAIEAAIKAGVDGIEFDVRLSKDGHLFLCHDPSLERTHEVDIHIAHSTAKQLNKIKGPDGDHVPSLLEAIDACQDKLLFIEAKSKDWAEPLAKVLKDHPKKKQFNVIAFDHQELDKFSNLCPEIPQYVLEHRNPFDAITAARVYGFSGIDINYWTMNPLSYWLAKRHGLKVIVFTANKRWIAKLLAKLYPDISITTDAPQLMRPIARKTKGLFKKKR